MASRPLRGIVAAIDGLSTAAGWLAGLLGLLLVLLFPEIALWFPRWLYGP